MNITELPHYDCDDFFPTSKEKKIGDRRLIVVEDTDPRVLEHIGITFGIPPVFFLAHCDGWVNLSIVDQACAKQSCSRYWRVPVPQIRAIPSTFKGPYGNYVIETGNVDRWSVKITPQTKHVNFRSQVSYWGQKDGEDGWIAILLVDPHQVSMRLETLDPKNPNACYKLDNWKPSRNIFSEASVKPFNAAVGLQGWSMNFIHQSYHTPIFDAINMDTSTGIPPHTDDPFSGTFHARNFIRSAWEEWMYQRVCEFDDQFLNEHRSHSLYLESGALGSSEKELNEAVNRYNTLIGEIRSIKIDLRHVRSIIWAFRCKDPDYLREQKTYLKVKDQPEHTTRNEDFITAMDVANAIEEESKLWIFLENKLEVMESDINNHMETFSQLATMEEAVASSKQARSGGQLTKIATVVVPCSFVASIFSMGGDFAVGGSLFFLYWAITVPATLALLAWVLHKDIKDSYRNRFLAHSMTPDANSQATIGQNSGLRRLLGRRQKSGSSDVENAEKRA
ncbi:magnesium and cobalt transport protein [Diplodia corticola]|uniref:Magnesium and cobalt transport protein n=1 Tax=Diplodia corticola TaxID=236234 RepID=A0A1J9RXP0_9PEZI|nr:magnesium and cobalt transport protein [Diplodia corticola]OJD33119.1 magnesium and cobalt transport protein [Diplodia corticola]